MSPIQPPSAPPDATPVIPATRLRQFQHGLASFMQAIGWLAVMLESMQPQLLQTFPKVAWLPPAIALLGALYKAYLRAEEKPVGVNYSSPPGVPSEAMQEIGEAAARAPSAEHVPQFAPMAVPETQTPPGILTGMGTASVPVEPSGENGGAL